MDDPAEKVETFFNAVDTAVLAVMLEGNCNRVSV